MPQQVLDLRPLGQEEELDLQPLDLEPVEPEPSTLKKAWDWYSGPLWEGPSRWAKSFSDWFTEPTMASSPTGEGGLVDAYKKLAAQARGFQAGAMEGLGNLVSGFTSPMAISTAGLTTGSTVAGRQGLREVARVLSGAGKIAAAPMIAHGGYTAVAPESTLTERGFGLAELAGGGLAMAHTPTIKPKTEPILMKEDIAPTVKPIEPPKVGIKSEVQPTKQTRIIEETKATPEGLANLVEKGWKVVGKNEQGAYIFEKESPVTSIPETYKPLDLDAPTMIGRTPRQLLAEIKQWRADATRYIKEIKETGDPTGDAWGQLENAQGMIDVLTKQLADARMEFAQRQGYVPPSTTAPSKVYTAADAPLPPWHSNMTDDALAAWKENWAKEQNAKGATPATTPQGKLLTYVITKDKATSDLLQNAVEQGWKLVKQNSRGDYIFQKEAPSGAVPPKGAAKTPAPEDYTLPQKQGTPGNVKKIMESGYKFVGLDESGNYLFKRTRKTAKMPILEEEVAGKHPTPKAVREELTREEIASGKLGPAMDVRKSNYIAEAFNLGRGLKASWDFSAPLRQGITLIHKPAFWKAFRPMMKAWATEEGFRASQDSIQQRPLFKPSPPMKAGGKPGPSFAEEAGLKLTDLTDLTKREEAIMSTWAEKVPMVRRSNRAYTAFLNNLRADVFEALIRDSDVLGAGGKNNMILARAIADYVNTASGRGSLKGTVGKGRWKIDINLEPSAVALNSTLFAPRLIASRLKLLNPLYYKSAPPIVRKEALKSLFALAGAGQIVTQLGRMAGGTVSTDPTSADFGKLKIGNTRIDPYAGFQQYVVAATRLLSGQSTSSTTGKTYDLWNPKGPYDPTIGSTLGRFGRGKLHPTLGFVFDIITGSKDMTGKPLNFTTMNPMENAAIQQFIPLFLQDLYELYETDPELLPIAGPLASLGIGVQSYKEY